MASLSPALICTGLRKFFKDELGLASSIVYNED